MITCHLGLLLDPVLFWTVLHQIYCILCSVQDNKPSFALQRCVLTSEGNPRYLQDRGSSAKQCTQSLENPSQVSATRLLIHPVYQHTQIYVSWAITTCHTYTQRLIITRVTLQQGIVLGCH